MASELTFRIAGDIYRILDERVTPEEHGTYVEVSMCPICLGLVAEIAGDLVRQHGSSRY